MYTTTSGMIFLLGKGAGTSGCGTPGAARGLRDYRQLVSESSGGGTTGADDEEFEPCNRPLPWFCGRHASARRFCRGPVWRRTLPNLVGQWRQSAGRHLEKDRGWLALLVGSFDRPRQRPRTESLRLAVFL